MRKKLGTAVGAIALTFVLSSCWALQSFGVLDYTLTPGQSTKARFVLRPAAGDRRAALGVFVIVGVGQCVRPSRHGHRRSRRRRGA